MPRRRRAWRTLRRASWGSSTSRRCSAGNRQSATKILLDAVDDGLSIRDAYLQVLLPVQREVGVLWHQRELLIAQEHFVSSTTATMMGVLARRGAAAEPNGKTAVVACVDDNPHDLGPRAVADFLEMAGWNVVFLGGNMPPGEIVLATHAFEPDLVALAAALTAHLPSLERTVEELRSAAPDVKILVGGRIFLDAPGLPAKVGADATAGDLDDAVRVAGELVGL